MSTAECRRPVAAVLFLVGTLAAGLAQTITVTTPHSPLLWAVGTFGAAQLTGGPGTDFTNTHTTASDWININLTLRAINNDYRVDVHKTDITWNPNLRLYIRRTADGVNPGAPPPGSISGGSAYQEIDGTTRSFFSGRRARINVKCQLELLGVSAALGPNNYRTTVTFTITDW